MSSPVGRKRKAAKTARSPARKKSLQKEETPALAAASACANHGHGHGAPVPGPSIENSTVPMCDDQTSRVFESVTAQRNWHADICIPWIDAWMDYKSRLSHTTVEITGSFNVRCNSEKTILDVLFRTPENEGKDRNEELYTFVAEPVDKEILSPVPGAKHLEWSTLRQLRVKEHRKNYEEIYRAVLDTSRYARSYDWLRWKKEPDDLLEGVECTNTLSWQNFSMAALEVLEDERLPKKEMQKKLRDLLVRGEYGYRRDVLLPVVEAFMDGMKDGPGRKGVDTLLEHLVNVVDRDRLRVKQHGASNDDYSTQLVLIPDVVSQQVSTSPSASRAASDVGDVYDASEDLDICSDADDSSSFKTSLASLNCARKDHADMTVFVRKDFQVTPLLVVDIKSLKADDTFQMQKHLLGCLQFRNEIFGLSINPVAAKIIRMKKDNSTKKIFYSHQVYGFTTRAETQSIQQFNCDEFLRLTDDLCKIFMHGLKEIL